MAPNPKSPTQAFEPSPAMTDGNIINKENTRMASPTSHLSTSSEPVLPTNRRPSREVRFSPITSPVARAQSMSFNPPMLEQISSASELPRSNRNTSISASTDLTAYIEQSRSVLETQRLSFERERSSWAEERKLWDTERAMLQARIAELEFTINKSGIRKSSTDSSHLNMQPFVAGHANFGSISNGHDSRRTSSSGSGQQVWEGPGAGTVATRVFSNEEKKKAEEHLPSIAEAESPGKPLSLKTNEGRRKSSTMGIPIEKVDSKLDGITLKASSLPPAFVAKVMTPTSASPAQSPSLRSNAPPPLNLKVLGEMKLDESNLTKDAGHTPMGPRVALQGVVDTQSNVDTSTQECPFAPPVSVRPPSEGRESYFPEPNDDPELKGPLTLENKSESENDNQFLHELDEKLLNEARKVVYEPSDTSTEDQDGDDDDDDDSVPKLKLKQSMNFGSKFGSSSCGDV